MVGDIRRIRWNIEATMILEIDRPWESEECETATEDPSRGVTFTLPSFAQPVFGGPRNSCRNCVGLHLTPYSAHLILHVVILLELIQHQRPHLSRPIQYLLLKYVV